MTKLLYRLRGWLTVPDAAAHLSTAYGEKVTEADALRLGLDGYLTLSANFVTKTMARLGRINPESSESKDVVDLSEDDFQAVKPEKVVPIDGIWDLAMVGTERGYVEHRYRTLMGVPSEIVIDADGVILNRPDGAWCQLVWPFTNGGKQVWLRSEFLPDDAVLVVRTVVLDELIRRMPTPLHDELPTLKTTEPTGERSEQAEPAGRTQMVGGSRLANWLAMELKERDMTVNRLHELAVLDRKTIKKVLDGKSVRQSHLRKLASGLSDNGRHVSVSDIPTN